LIWLCTLMKSSWSGVPANHFHTVPYRFNLVDNNCDKINSITSMSYIISHCDLLFESIFISVTRRVKGSTRFVGKYVTGRRMHFWPHKVYIFLITITSRVDLAMSVCPPVRLSARPDERPSVRLSVCPSVCPDERSLTRPSVRLSVCPDERWDLGTDKSVCLSVRMNAEISETIN